jgi:hypothetical protein
VNIVTFKKGPKQSISGPCRVQLYIEYMAVEKKKQCGKSCKKLTYSRKKKEDHPELDVVEVALFSI